MCNNMPLWSLRAESRMIMAAVEKNLRYTDITNSLFNDVLISNILLRQSIPSASGADADSKEDDPSIWLPACIAEVEKLAVRCKTIASKVGNNWRSGDINREDSETSLDKNKVVNCCRELRKAITDAQSHMVTLEKKIVKRYTRTYGSTVEIEVDSSSDSSDSSTSLPNSGNTPSDKRLVLKIKNFRESKRPGSEQDYYAEIRGSPNVQQGATQSVSRADNKIPKISKQTANLEDSKIESLYNACSNLSDAKHLKESQLADAVRLEPVDSTDFHSSDFDPLELLESGPTITEIDDSEVKCRLSTNSPSFKRKKQLEAFPSKGKESKLKQTSLDENEKARRELLKDSSDDSEDSSIDLKVSKNPRLKKTSKRSRNPIGDTKLSSECAVVVDKIAGTVSLQLHFTLPFLLINCPPAQF